MHTDITRHGARSSAEIVNTAAIQAAIDAVAAEGGRVTVPPGTFKTGTVQLRSGVELHLSHGATLLGTNNPDDYPAWYPEGLVQTRRPFVRRMILGADCDNVAVTGSGTIDGDGGCAGAMPTGNESRPINLHFVACRRVTVRDVNLRCSGSWMQKYMACDDVFVHGIRVWNHDNRTNDGLDFDGCTDVRVSDCDIDSRDDALVIKSTGPRACRNIVVTNCRLRSNCHGIKFGTESVGGFENIRISGCVISPSRHPEPIEGYPQGRPVITGCALECTDGGTMRAIQIDGLIVERAFAPIFIRLGNRMDRRIEGDTPPEAGVLEDVRIRNVIARQCGPISCSVSGYPGHPVRRVHIADVDIEHVGGVQAEAILAQPQENSSGYPEINMYGNKKGMHLPSYGFYLRHVEDLLLDNIRIRLMRPDARAPIVHDDVTGLRIRDVSCGDLRDEQCLRGL